MEYYLVETESLDREASPGWDWKKGSSGLEDNKLDWVPSVEEITNPKKLIP